MKCHRTGKPLYAMDNPIKIKIDGEDVFYSKIGFKCLGCGVALKPHDNNWAAYLTYFGGTKDVYHRHHKPTVGPKPSVVSEGTSTDQVLNKVKAEAAANNDGSSSATVSAARQGFPGQATLKKTAGPSAAAPVPADPVPATTAPAPAKPSPEKVVPGMTQLKPGEKGSSYNLSADRTVSPKKGRTVELEVPTGPKPSEENLEKFRLVNEKQPDDQSSFFLMAFAADFNGRSEEVLECADGFKKYLEPGGVSLSEVDSHRLLEELGRAKTYQEMRDVIREIDQDSDGRVSLIEWLLFEFKKSVNELFSQTAPPELAAIMKKAIDRWHAIHDKKNKKLSEVEELEALVAKGGIKGMQAKMKLLAIKQMGVDGNDNAEEIRAAVQKKKAESMVQKYATDKAKEEEARVAEKKRLENEARIAKAKAGKAALMARMANFHVDDAAEA